MWFRVRLGHLRLGAAAPFAVSATAAKCVGLSRHAEEQRHLEAVEDLLASGYVPRRTVFLLFGHDEEVGGEAGARQTAI